MVHSDLAELDPLVLVPLRRGDLRGQLAALSPCVALDLLQRPGTGSGPSRRACRRTAHLVSVGALSTHAVERLAPDTRHLVEPEVFGVLVQLLVEPVEGPGTRLAGAGNVGTSTYRRTPSLASAAGCRLLVFTTRVQPGDWVLILAVDRPFDLVDQGLSAASTSRNRRGRRRPGAAPSGRSPVNWAVSSALTSCWKSWSPRRSYRYLWRLSGTVLGIDCWRT